MPDCSDADQVLTALLSGEKIDLGFTDIVMPGTMTGLDLAREMQCRNLAVGVLVGPFVRPLQHLEGSKFG